MNLLAGYIFPHPPIIIPEIGRGEGKDALKTIEGVNHLAQEIAGRKPDTIILITPHGPVFSDAVCISIEQKLYGDFGQFGKGNLKLQFENNTEMAERIAECAQTHNITVGRVDKSFAKRYSINEAIDHGALVPMYFVNKYYSNYKFVHISMGLLSYEKLYEFGMCIDDIIRESDENVVVIASGDLSHRLTKDAPAGYNERGKEFDETIISLIQKNDVEKILNLDVKLIESAGECGLRPIIILHGVLDRYNVKPNVISYEGPFGVGYSTVKFAIEEVKETGIYEKILLNKSEKMESIRKCEDEYVALARTALKHYLLNGVVIEPPQETSDELLKSKAGVFVSLKKDGQLRGCIGTTGPTQKNIAEEIIHNAISSGTRDSRFNQVDDYELEDLIYSVDVLTEPEPIKSKDELEVKRYGVIVRKGNRSGLLLPDLEGVDTVDDQIEIALSKGGIKPDESYQIERFEVIRHGTK